MSNKPELMLWDRQLHRILRAPFRTEHYRALLQMVQVFPEWPEFLWRYVTSKGSYPWRVRIRTPVGEIAPVVYHAHDVRTVNEIFCRGDYHCRRDVRTIVDVGSNIGLSALFFLSRNKDVRCFLFEPLPENVQKLRHNLGGFESRYTLSPTAVATQAGEFTFYTEPTGRYGTLLKPLDGQIRVECQEINAVLDSICENENFIDVLKLDIEGLERDVVGAISENNRRRIGTVMYELAESIVRENWSTG